MYRQYFNLRSKPFSLAPDPNVVFMSEAHKEALATLRYGVLDKKGFLLLTGEVGSGKTTLLQLLIESLQDEVHLCHIANPTLSANDFLYFLARRFGLEFEGNKAKFLMDFAEYLQHCHNDNQQALLIVDEAHLLSVELLEELRLLSNQAWEEYGVLSVFLVGQPELNDRLADDRLLPLRNRISIRFHINPFNAGETRQYILFRLQKAGAGAVKLFDDDAVQEIHTASQGIPRTINILADHALLSAFSENKNTVDLQIVKECASELAIKGRAADNVKVQGCKGTEGKPFALWLKGMFPVFWK